MSSPSSDSAYVPELLFDVHLDLSYNALDFNRDLRWTQERIRRHELGMTDQRFRTRNTVCFPEMRRGNVGLCVATQIARSVDYFSRMPGWTSPEQAWAQTQGQLAWYREMEACGELVQIRDRRELDSHLAKWLNAQPGSQSKLPIGYILSLEGADSIVSWRNLEDSYANGLRALGPVHYGPGVYGMGTDAEGPLTPRGRDLLKEMERLGIILDATHLCDESFWDALNHYNGPVWASHSNCRAIANWNRQFDDDQIKALAERGAVIGMAFDAIMMVQGWAHLRSTAREFDLRIEKICEHIDHICQLTGSTRHIGIGSDLDGGFGTEQTPLDLDSIADLRKLSGHLLARGYSKEDIDGIFYGNFVAFLRRAWAA
ncbi:dipeptidase [Planctomicrobium sp. SH664]|uniref:dipeptidase n=1 Tax=Planctomicrobium sp. SH664 TaxID=3448125 RepID=UPI003F5BFEFC